MHNVIIIGTVPYKRNGPSRAYESYFANWDQDKLAQIFSNQEAPMKGHCSTFFQITDTMLLRRWFHSNEIVGKIYQYRELYDEGTFEPSPKSKKRAVIDKLIHSGSSHTPLVHLLRGILWRESFWCTRELTSWLDKFSPECVFVSFSDDFFILNLAIYVSKRYSIPIVPTISDDYYFIETRNRSIFYKIYKIKYKKLVDDLISRCSGALYISDKIRDKYNTFFGLQGQTVYLHSDIQRKEFQPINKDHIVISYFGNVLLDRYISIVEIAQALKEINPDYIINVYSGQIDKKVLCEFKKNSNIFFCGSVSYSDVITKTKDSDIILVVEAFTEYNINSTRYSLSTKAADSLKSGANILAYGSEECGLIDYLKRNDACVCCTEKTSLKAKIVSLINDISLQRFYYDRAEILSYEHHNIQKSTSITEEMINYAIKYTKRDGET